jgi:transposase
MRKTYPPEFKAEAFRLVRENGMGVARVATNLGLKRTLVRDWVLRADEAALAGTPAATTVATMADELARLRRENAVLREEREILNRAAAFFAKENRRGTSPTPVSAR